MSLAKEISELMESQRVVLTSRQEICKLRLQQYRLWAMKAKRAGAEDVGVLVEQTFVHYYDQELLSIEFLLTTLKEAQENIVATVTAWEAQKEAENAKHHS